MSLFYDFIKQKFYIFDWVDRNECVNRWLIYGVSPHIILNFMMGKMSLLNMFKMRSEMDVYYIDLHFSHKNFYEVPAYLLKSIPDTYYPNENNYFDKEDCPEFDKIFEILTSSLNRNDMKNEYKMDSKINFQLMKPKRLSQIINIPKLTKKNPI